jgi:3-oxoacyl-[acyl-carrier protein] reductase
VSNPGGRLLGRVVLVTGAGNGIGRAVARRLATEGAAVALADVDNRAAETAADELQDLGFRAFACGVDVARENEVRDAVAAVNRELGHIDVLANVAGIYGRHAPVRQLDLEDWREVIGVNLTGTFLCSRAVLPGMIERGWGRIVNVASGHALRGRPNVAPYAASKAGVIGFTKALALEVARNGVTVNAVMPAVTDTAVPRQYA